MSKQGPTLMRHRVAAVVGLGLLLMTRALWADAPSVRGGTPSLGDVVPPMRFTNGSLQDVLGALNAAVADPAGYSGQWLQLKMYECATSSVDNAEAGLRGGASKIQSAVRKVAGAVAPRRDTGGLGTTVDGVFISSWLEGKLWDQRECARGAGVITCWWTNAVPLSNALDVVCAGVWHRYTNEEAHVIIVSRLEDMRFAAYEVTENVVLPIQAEPVNFLENVLTATPAAALLVGDRTLLCLGTAEQLTDVERALRLWEGQGRSTAAPAGGGGASHGKR